LFTFRRGETLRTSSAAGSLFHLAIPVDYSHKRITELQTGLSVFPAS
jgi:hypothetical protein